MVFKNYAEYYNLLYQDKDYTGESKYISKLINTYSKTDVKKVLNLGCGTGNHDEYLANDGFDITGVDFSQEMIDIAKSKKQKNIKYLCGNIQNAEIDDTFDCTLALFHVMSYQNENTEIEKTLQNVRKHLKDNGLFIFDFWYGPAVLTDLPETRVKYIENENLKITRIAEPEFFENKNVVDVNYTLILKDKKSNSIQEINEKHSMRYFFLPELKYILEKNNFSVIKELKWMSEDERLSFNSWNGLLITQKNA